MIDLRPRAGRSTRPGAYDHVTARNLRWAVIALAACTTPVPSTPTPAPPVGKIGLGADPRAFVTSEMDTKVVAEFEAAVLASQQAYAALFDYAAVGEYEILLHRYDLNRRMPELTDAEKKQFAAEDGTPYPAARERKNVGAFFPILAQRTVGTGGCVAGPPRTTYAAHLYEELEPLPAGTPAKYETLRTHVNAWHAAGGVVSFTCTGEGGLTIVYTKRENPRGYDLITIYDD